MTKTSIDWNHLNADEHAKLEKMMPLLPRHPRSVAGGQGQRRRGGTIGHSAMRVLEVFFTFMPRRLGESLRLSYETIAEAALLSPRTVGRAVRRLAGLGLITIQGDSVYEITPLVKVAR